MLACLSPLHEKGCVALSHGKGRSTGTPCKISDKFLLLQDFGQISWLAGRKKNLCLIKWYGENAVPHSHCFALIEWYGEGAVPSTECFLRQVWVTVGGTAPPLYQASGIYSFLLFHLFTLSPLYSFTFLLFYLFTFNHPFKLFLRIVEPKLYDVRKPFRVIVGNCHPQSRQLPSTITAIANNNHGNCQQQSRQLPSTITAIAIHNHGNCHPLLRQLPTTI